MKASSTEWKVLHAQTELSWLYKLKARRDAWLLNLEQVPEGHATIFFTFLSIGLWGVLAFFAWLLWA